MSGDLAEFVNVHIFHCSSLCRSIEEPNESPAPVCERVMSSSPRSSCGSGQQSTKLNLKPRKLHTPEKDTSSSKKGSSSLQEDENPTQEDPVSTQKGDSFPQNDNIISPESRVTVEQKEDPHSHKDSIHVDHSFLQTNSTSSPVEVISPHRKSYSKEVVSEPSDTLPKVIQEGDSSDTSQNTTKATVISQGQEEEICLQLDDSVDECPSMDNPEEEQDIEVVLEVSKGQQTKKETTQSKPISPKNSNTKEIKVDSVPLNNLPQLPSVPEPIVTCSKEVVVDEPSTDTLLPSCSAPPARVTRTKQRGMEASRDASPSSDSLPRSPSVPAPRVTRTKQKVTKVQDVLSPSDSFPKLPVAPALRVTCTKQRAIEAQDAVLISPLSPFAPAPRLTRTKQRAIEAQDAVLTSPPSPAPRVTRTKQKAIEKEVSPSPPSLPQPAPRMTRTKQKAKDMDSLQQTTSIKLGTKHDQEHTKPRVIQVKRTDQHHPQEEKEEDDTNTKASSVKDSGVFSLGVKNDGWGSAESLLSEESSAPPIQPSTPPVRITRSKMSKLQRPQHSPEKALPATDRFPRVYCSPRGTALTKSPCNKSPATR